MTLRTLVLLSAALGLGLIGLGYLAAPQVMYGLYGIDLETVNEANMVRSAYGGVFLALSVLLALGATKEHFARPALIALLTFMTGFALGRAVSVVVDGLPSALILALLATEITYAALATYLLAKKPPTQS